MSDGFSAAGPFTVVVDGNPHVQTLLDLILSGTPLGSLVLLASRV